MNDQPDYRLDTLHKLRSVFAQMSDIECALMGAVRCTKCQNTHRVIICVPDWALSPTGMMECASCHEMSCVFVYDDDFRRILSTRQEREGWCRMPGEFFKKDVCPTLYVVQESLDKASTDSTPSDHVTWSRDLARQLRKQREELGLRMTDVTKSAGLSTIELSNIERALNSDDSEMISVDADVLCRIKEALNHDE